MRNGYHGPNSCTTILTPEASRFSGTAATCAGVMQYINEFDDKASQHSGTLPVRPNFGCDLQTPDLRSIGWRARKQDNAVLYSIPFISFLRCFITVPAFASNLPESSGVCRGQLSPDLAAAASSPLSMQA
jgi:hypothetical protein